MTQNSSKTKNLTLKTEIFKKQVRAFVAQEYEQKLEQADFESDDKFEDVFNYVGIIVQPELMRRGMRHRTHIRFLTLYYDCVYRYTHKKISKLFSDQVLRFIFEDYISSGMIYKMIETDPTLCKNKEIYQETVKMFMRSFTNQEYELIRK